MLLSPRWFGMQTCVAVTALLTLAASASAKRVICVDAPMGGNDPAINIKEGYERALGITSPPDVVDRKSVV